MARNLLGADNDVIEHGRVGTDRAPAKFDPNRNKPRVAVGLRSEGAHEMLGPLMAGEISALTAAGVR
jgi:hypothetical protein